MLLWELYSRFYDISLRNLFPYRQLVEQLNRALELKDGDMVLDAGCGPGHLIERLMGETGVSSISVTGLDLSQGMIKRARKKLRNLAHVELRVADLNKDLDLPDGRFDKMVCSNALYALENPRRVMAEFHRVLKPGGALIIANPKPDAGQKAILREHIRTLKQITSLRKRAYHTMAFVLLIPVNLVVSVINRTIIDRARDKQYHFLDEETLEAMLRETGFAGIDVRSCYADQGWLVKARKQQST